MTVLLSRDKLKKIIRVKGDSQSYSDSESVYVAVLGNFAPVKINMTRPHSLANILFSNNHCFIKITWQITVLREFYEKA